MRRGVSCRRWGVPLIDGGTVRLPRLVGVSRAMDMIRTGRAVGAAEAEQIGLVNRVAPSGQSLAAAQELAASLAQFPQTCLREDRLSLLEQEGLTETEAIANELAHGRRSLADVQSGLERFRSGAGCVAQIVLPSGCGITGCESSPGRAGRAGACRIDARGPQ